MLRWDGTLAGLDIGSGEVTPFGEQWFAQHFREGVCEAVSKVEPRWVSTFAILPPSQTRKLNLLNIYRGDLHLRLVEEEVKLPPRSFATSGFQHDTRLESVCRRDPAGFGLGYCLQESPT